MWFRTAIMKSATDCIPSISAKSSWISNSASSALTRRTCARLSQSDNVPGLVESVLFEEVPFFRSVFDGTTKYRWRRSSGEEGEHEFWTRTGQIQPHRLRRYFDSHLVRETKTSNLKVLSAEAGGFIDRAVELGRQGVTMYVYPKPSTALFPVSES